MSQRKKKPSQQHLDKIQKAQHRNEFIGKIKYLCDNLSGDKKVFTLIPSLELEKMYDLRSRAIRIIPEQESEVEDDLLKSIKKLLPAVLKITKVPVTEKGDLQISISDFYNVAQTLYGYHA